MRACVRECDGKRNTDTRIFRTDKNTRRRARTDPRGVRVWRVYLFFLIGHTHVVFDFGPHEETHRIPPDDDDDDDSASYV